MWILIPKWKGEKGLDGNPSRLVKELALETLRKGLEGNADKELDEKDSWRHPEAYIPPVTSGASTVGPRPCTRML